MKRLTNKEWRNILQSALQENKSPKEVSVAINRNLNTVLNAENRYKIWLPRKKPQHVFNGIEWRAFLTDAVKSSLTASELAVRIGVSPSLVYAAERRTGIYLKRIR